MSSVFQIFAIPLRKRGFRKTDDSRAGGVRVVIWEKQVKERKLDLQLWADGLCRVSHSLAGRSSTTPTEFRTVEEMDAAIAHELARTDHNPRQ